VARRTSNVPRHGGAWKVAYADFVTALLALFIVLWMMNSSEGVKAAVHGYFHDPRGYTRTLGAGAANVGEALKVNRRNVEDLQKQIETALRQLPDFNKLRDNVKLTVTGEGLRIELMENEQGLFFITGRPEPTAAGQKVLAMVAEQIRKMPNKIVIEGHTDALPFRHALPSSKYGNWELSTDRANAARRLLIGDGVGPSQIVEVRGFADQNLLLPEAPGDPRNRRISLVVKFTAE
jgi:chemotaxis protein MotB